MVLLWGMGESGGKTTWEEESRERDEEERRNHPLSEHKEGDIPRLLVLPTLAARVKPV